MTKRTDNSGFADESIDPALGYAAENSGYASLPQTVRDAIERGLADLASGRVAPAEEVFASITARIAAARRAADRS